MRHFDQNVLDLNAQEFRDELAKRTTAFDIFDNAPRIYDYMTDIFGQNCGDSVLREWAFEWYTEETGENYDSIYNKWLEGA